MAVSMVVWKITEIVTSVRGKQDVNNTVPEQWRLRSPNLMYNLEMRRKYYNIFHMTPFDSTDYFKSITSPFLWQGCVFLVFSAIFRSKDVYLKKRTKDYFCGFISKSGLHAGPWALFIHCYANDFSIYPSFFSCSWTIFLKW